MSDPTDPDAENRPDLDAIEAFLEDCRAGRLPAYGLDDMAPAMLHACVGEIRRLRSLLGIAE